MALRSVTKQVGSKSFVRDVMTQSILFTDLAKDQTRHLLEGVARGGAGALLFAVPMFMTNELWDFGHHIDPLRLLFLLILNIPLLVLLARQIGFEETFTWGEAVRDAMIAYGLGIVVSAVALVMIGILNQETVFETLIGSTAIQSVPASIGALLGRSAFGGGYKGKKKEQNAPSLDGSVSDPDAPSYLREIFLMGVGAVYLCMHVAPADEVMLVSYKMSFIQALSVMIASIVIMQAFVCTVLTLYDGTNRIPGGEPRWRRSFFRFTLPGYVVALTISLTLLYVFGRLDGVAPSQCLIFVIVLSLPGAIGAAASRLIF